MRIFSQPLDAFDIAFPGFYCPYFNYIGSVDAELEVVEMLEI